MASFVKYFLTAVSSVEIDVGREGCFLSDVYCDRAVMGGGNLEDSDVGRVLRPVPRYEYDCDQRVCVSVAVIMPNGSATL
jgi:hypothetical protein